MKYRNDKLYLVLAVLFLIGCLVSAISLIHLNSIYCVRDMPGFGFITKSTVIDSTKINRGYTLITSMNKLPVGFKSGGGKVVLVDLYGKVVHEWYTLQDPLYAILKENGHLVVELFDPKVAAFPGGGTGIIQELDWKGNVIWEYRNSMIHHDIDVLPNGNIATLLWEPLSADLVSRIKGGIAGTEINVKMLGDVIVEIDSKGEIVWRWNIFDHLNVDEDFISPTSDRSEWTHANSIRYVKKDPILGQEAYLVSLRQVNRVLLVSKKNGTVIWKSPNTIFSGQHDATLLKNGNILVFDNGVDKTKVEMVTSFYSRVLEINPKTNEVVWEFSGGETVIEKMKFFSVIVSGAQRLDNGNTLITDGSHGFIFEVTRDKKIVWNMINLFGGKSTGDWGNNMVFKARRYGDEIYWPEILSDPLPWYGDFCPI